MTPPPMPRKLDTNPTPRLKSTPRRTGTVYRYVFPWQSVMVRGLPT